MFSPNSLIRVAIVFNAIFITFCCGMKESENCIRSKTNPPMNWEESSFNGGSAMYYICHRCLQALYTKIVRFYENLYDCVLSVIYC